MSACTRRRHRTPGATRSGPQPCARRTDWPPPWPPRRSERARQHLSVAMRPDVGRQSRLLRQRRRSTVVGSGSSFHRPFKHAADELSLKYEVSQQDREDNDESARSQDRDVAGVLPDEEAEPGWGGALVGILDEYQDTVSYTHLTLPTSYACRSRWS